MRRILIAGTNSGVGKTTVTAGLIAALCRRGHSVVPFKVGPDYIDPGFHGAAAGVPAGNLDSWMVPQDQVLETLHRRVPKDAIVVIEGVMGLFDGRKGMGEVGSSAHVAKITDTPVVLVASGAKMARSAAAMVSGYVNFDPDLDFAGVIFNQLSGDSHYQILHDAVCNHLTVPVLGYLPRDTQVAIPERHLGLMPSAEKEKLSELLTSLADLVEANLDVEAIIAAASNAKPLPKPKQRVFPAEPAAQSCRIAVARDEAFHFYYPENLDLLTAFGAEIVPFSPLHDGELPEDIQGVMLGGGFPEMFADKLTANATLRSGLAKAVKQGMPVYAECGGYMFLAQDLADFAGLRYPMTGVFPGHAEMRSKRRALGYVEVAGAPGNFLLPENETCRGHEFHWSDMQDCSQQALYLKQPTGDPVGERIYHCLGSYIHLHFLSNPGVAKRFVEKCVAFGRFGGNHENS